MHGHTSRLLGRTLLAAGMVITIGCNDVSSPTSTGFKPSFALDDVTSVPQDPVFGKILVCKTGDSNVSGSFTIVKNSGTGTAGTSPFTVAPGTCVEVANDFGTGGTSSFAITENAAADPANTTQALVACSRKDEVLGVVFGPSDCLASINTNDVFVNIFHSFVLTYKNVFTPPDNGCTFTLGYWLNHPDAWPVSSLTLGSVVYTKAQLLAILGTAPKGNGLIQLARQLIAAKLNVASGATTTSAIADADALIGALVVPPVGSGFLDPSVTSALISALNSYNTGATGPGSCEE